MSRNTYVQPISDVLDPEAIACNYRCFRSRAHAREQNTYLNVPKRESLSRVRLMNQNDQANLTGENLSAILPEKNQLDSKKADMARKNIRHREWLPEDDDDWYEPDYVRHERGN